ncbi:putative C-type lectin domain family 4 member M-like, partial [Triplophysa rosa]
SEITLATVSVCEDRTSIIEFGTSCEHIITNKNSGKLHKGCNITWNRCYRFAAQFFGLLCVVLLAAIIMLYVENKHLQTNYNRVTDERTEYLNTNALATARDQHQDRFNNLSLEKEQLENNYRIIQVSYSSVVEERDLLQNITLNITKEKNQLQSLISNLVKEKDKLRILSNNLTREKDQSESRYKAMSEQSDQLQNWYNSMTEEKVRLQTLTSNQAEERDNLTKERDKLQLEKGGLQKALYNFGWKYFKSSMYSISTVKMNWTVGRQHCRKSEADLVVINSKEEMIFVHGLISNLGAWLGLTDTENEGVWKWVDGKELTTSYWMKGQPNNGGRNGNDDCVLESPFHYTGTSKCFAGY